MVAKYISLFSCLFTVGLITAESGDCFSGKSLEELKVMHDIYMKGIEKTPEYEKVKIARKQYSDYRETLIKATFNCIVFKEISIIALITGIDQEDCDLIKSYEDEYMRLEKIKRYAEERLGKVVQPELKLLSECIVAREYDAIDISEKIV
ncbi:MAG TPA: hypothetical protein VKR54_03595 [Candidatus Babeliales bacterium]|jgi:hypothetical protein|nr:hypothetical protein [Candidatus Babeliales bacterium]